MTHRTALPEGYSYRMAAPGLLIYAPSGADVFLQPGDDMADALYHIEAWEAGEIPDFAIVFVVAAYF